MIAAIDVQHRGKPGEKINDRGAFAFNIEEVTLTHRYALAADQRLRQLGHSVIILSDGFYADRVKRAANYGAKCYIACHVDAGGGNRGTAYYDSRSSPGNGARLAHHIATELGKSVPWPCKSEPTKSGERAFNTIKDVYDAPQFIVGICYEPGFVDGPEAHRTFLMMNCEVLGHALAVGIDEWIKTLK